MPTHPDAAAAVPPRRYLTTKVPQLTAFFWIVKILTTGMGEATSDFLAHRFNPFVAVAVGGVAFAIAIVIQFAQRTYVPWIYWLAVAMVSVFGTMAADGLHIQFHVPYIASTALYAVVLAVIFAVWHRMEGTLSIHSINTPRRELFYWATVLATFALGTAAGDFTATKLKLGYFSSGLLFAAAFAVPALLYLFFKVSPILTFWWAYVLTRPLGASFADWMGVPKQFGGLDFGRGNVAMMLAVPIILIVAYLQVSKRDIQDLLPGTDQAAPASRAS